MSDWADEKSEEIAAVCVHFGETHVMSESVQARYALALRHAHAKGRIEGIEAAAKQCDKEAISHGDEGPLMRYLAEAWAKAIRELKDS